MSRQCIDVSHKYNERNQRKSISKLLKRETKLIQLEIVQFFIVLKAEKLTGKEMKDFSEAFLARIRSISEFRQC